MKIIIGLGNPGAEYENTRHNVGFMFVDKMAKEGRFLGNKRFESEVLSVDGMLLVKPLTFMNESGRAVRRIVDFYKLDETAVILVHDDLDLPLGEKKIQMGVGPKVHNGVNSVEQNLGTSNFLRVRIGVDNRKNKPTKLPGSDYVLEKFGKDEQVIINEVIDKAIAELLITLGL